MQAFDSSIAIQVAVNIPDIFKNKRIANIANGEAKILTGNDDFSMYWKTVSDLFVLGEEKKATYSAAKIKALPTIIGHARVLLEIDRCFLDKGKVDKVLFGLGDDKLVTISYTSPKEPVKFSWKYGQAIVMPVLFSLDKK